MRDTTRGSAVAVFAACAVSVFGVTVVAEAAQRTFVSTSGSDANACTLIAPCRGFAKAITVTDVGGELVVLDSGGYGSVTVDKNVTILSPAGVYAGISVFAAQDGITVTAPATKVVLRGLAINGQGGNNGIRVQAGEVHVESSVISNMAQAGIRIEGGSSVRISGSVTRSNVDGLRIVPGAGTLSVLIRDSEFSNNATAGIGVSPSAAGASAQVTVERSSVTRNGVGLTAAPSGSATASLVVTQSVASENGGAGVSSSGAGASVYVRESAITRNGTGLLQASSGVLFACGANLLVANGVAQSGAINTSSCLDVASAGPANAFMQGGNAFGATALLGTNDNQPLDLRVNGSRVMRYDPNAISPNVIGGSPANTVTAGVRGATIAGGGALANTDPDFIGEAPNRVTDAYGTVGGGVANVAGDDAGTTRDAGFATVGGGLNNAASGVGSTVGGGGPNTASGVGSTVGGGGPNTASGIYSTVGGGGQNTASGTYSTVGGGLFNIASGSNSFAAGFSADANTNGCFVWGDSSTSSPVSCNAPNRFVVRAVGGIFMFAGGTTQATYVGAVLAPGATAWTAGSDRETKEHVQSVDTVAVLRKVTSMPISTWNYKSQDPAVRHIGPMAQDFHAAFGLGETPKGISTIDADGVALAAIQALNAKLEQQLLKKDGEISGLKGELADLRRAVAVLMTRLSPEERVAQAR